LRKLVARRQAVAKRTESINQNDRPRVAFFEWLHPPFNGGHWNPALVELAGGVGLSGSHGEPSTTLDWQSIIEQHPDILYIACCGFRIDRALEDVALVSKTDAWQQIPAVQNGRVFLTDGNAYFSCPGPRLIDGLEIMAHALHPGVHPNLWPQEPT